MGKAGRVACITIPMALTIASFVCLALIEVSGWNKNTLNSLHFFEANLENLTVPSTGNDVITTAIDSVLTSGAVAKLYQVHLWNYCTANDTDGDIDQCSKRESNFVFDPLDVWGFEISNDTTATSTSSADNAIESAVATLKNNSEEYEDKILGESGRKALSAYRSVAKWMFIAYQVSFWTTLATIIVGILAIFSRWGSLITWILAFASSFFTIAAVLTSTILFSVLCSALNKALEDYGIKLSLGRSALTTCWLAVAFSWGATLFWLFSVCCCSGRSNPHHRSNKGGLWNAEPKGQGYGRGVTVEKTGGGYQRVASPYVGGHHDDQVPLQNFAAQPAGYNHQQGAGYEPYRHG
ncbi:hypothetical protein CLAFUW4_00620 [Fulvia fulva]|uniref:Uncharacterized protein n=1 Tax=Passalora fulva TaxID=5499 RepID=A0A9Q8L4V6_PASFU|nr:uncharacterized protein CLAFUR5_00619 [Fulvia fulva]KAK4635304.1 hypothetical protein CLAFUR4_00621 [Fulvia fulva]KAK4636822.1 hypothetical protein CLAFUR0_00622 [Fulvia fulva]UJO10856.1 hypothetical protein CLAFUR5_00619 [Fulvia fulva]WPV08649.1 hypothetical protein CLAFUW4_00620 [Fulvia fulva]WPV23413.1 hypothetical protein CLAFUW7_00625 [Fulvia fulva]